MATRQKKKRGKMMEKTDILKRVIIIIFGTILGISYIQYKYDPFSSETPRIILISKNQHTVFYEDIDGAIFQNLTTFDNLIIWDPKIKGEKVFPVKERILPEPPTSNFKFEESFFFIDSLKKTYVPLFKAKKGVCFFSKKNGELKQEGSLENDIIIANPETSSDESLVIINKDWISGEKKNLPNESFFQRKDLTLLNPSS
ncbi:MAG: hypothetical protein A2430_00285 [Candidatus Liptonbacteria bacterium RIFOXYC1_FULL_36_8]|nr:MAG: hypothetical protein A2604_01055 [Candidatus Liptonbacteria bacterium RIFOXYD1_FULL_36_11]OGZ03069.1 MAG: hypothetical protein A2430_00285 [Candidatus Liptonbacteria bacterium RIFOXYC1_FULL_36_8]